MSLEISADGLELIEFISIDCTSGDGEWYSDSEIKIEKRIRNHRWAKEN